MYSDYLCSLLSSKVVLDKPYRASNKFYIDLNSFNLLYQNEDNVDFTANFPYNVLIK
jgi:hypothetical protein